ncbi:hypothetical protein JCM18694_34480 [Prolixibacter denitrificans]|nr:hypothetical protein JCM18694_34480 [Prolixibacter denitrificans]
MKLQAINDLKAGKYKLYEFGIVSSPDTNRLIIRQLGIELIYRGCTVTAGIECYRAVMDSAVRVKFKNEIIDYPANPFDRPRFRSEFFNLTDSALLRINAKKISRVINALDELNEGKAHIQIFVDKGGEPIRIRWLGSLGKKNELNIANSVMKERFEPLIIGKDKVNTILTFPLKIE